MFLWSARVPWIAHSWLSEVVFYGVLHGGGERTGPFLLLGLNVLLTALAFAIVWRLWDQRARTTTLTAFLFILAIQASSQRFQIRPESFTAVFFASLLAFLVRWTPEQPEPGLKKKQLWPGLLLLPLLFTVWANFHGAVAFGLLILALTVGCDLVQERGSSASRKLALIAIFCAAATLINPYFVRYWTALGQIQSLTFKTIDEWKPFWKAPALGSEILVAQALLLTLAIIVWSWNPRRRWSHLAWLIVMGAAFISARRNGWLLSLTCLTTLAVNAPLLQSENLWREWQRQRRAGQSESAEKSMEQASSIPSSLRHGVHAFAIAALLFTIYMAWPAQPTQATNVPERLTRFLQSTKLPGRVFNNYDQSCYLHWRFQGNPPLFVDTLNVYPDSVTVDYSHIMNVTPQGHAMLDKLGIETVIMPRLEPGDTAPRLFHYLTSSPQWQLIYVENDGIVWVRRPQNKVPAKKQGR